MIKKSKEIFKSFDLENFPIFYQPFWLDLISGSDWKIIFIVEKGKVIAAMPLLASKKYSKRFLMPNITPYLGPYIDDELLPSKTSTKNSKIHKILEAFAESIPLFEYYEQNWHPKSNMWLPFYWKGFKQHTRYTYLLKISNLEKVWGDIKSNVRTDISKGKKILRIESSQNPNDIIDMMNKTFLRNNTKLPYSKSFLFNVINTCIINKKGIVYKCMDKENNIHSSAFIIWDKKCAYYLLGGSDTKFRNSGSMSFLLWNIISIISENFDYFDFEGSTIKNIERFFRAFGGQPTAYFQVSKTNSKWMHFKRLISFFIGNSDN